MEIEKKCALPCKVFQGLIPEWLAELADLEKRNWPLVEGVGSGPAATLTPASSTAPALRTS